MKGISILGEFVPFGATCIQTNQREQSAEDKEGRTECTLFPRHSSLGIYQQEELEEEEIYVKGNKMVWSGGGAVIMSITASSDIKAIERIRFTEDSQCIAILGAEGTKLRILRDQKPENTISLSFFAEAIYPSLNSLLIFAPPSLSLSQDAPILYSLSGSLDEVTPVSLITSMDSITSPASNTSPDNNTPPPSVQMSYTALLAMVSDKQQQQSSAVSSERVKILYSSAKLPLLVVLLGEVLAFFEVRVYATPHPSLVSESIEAPAEKQSQVYLQLIATEAAAGGEESVIVCGDEEERSLLCVLNPTAHTLTAFTLFSSSNNNSFAVKRQFQLDNVLSAAALYASRPPPLSAATSTLSTALNSYTMNCRDLLLLDTAGALSVHIGTHTLCKYSAAHLQLQITALHNAVGNRVNAVTHDAKSSTQRVYRLRVSVGAEQQLPADCFKVLKSVLPMPRYLHTLHSFLTASSSPATEWTLFSDSLISTLFTDNNSTAAVAKRTAAAAADDWQYLLHSDYHLAHRHALFHCLPFIDSAPSTPSPPTPTTSSTSSPPSSSTREEQQQVLYALHLLYENYKLNVVNWQYLQPLAQLLLRLAVQLGWRVYVEHYLRDFGELSVQVSVQQLQAVPDTSRTPLPDIHAWIARALSGQCTSYPLLPLSSHSPYSHAVNPCQLTRKICRLYELLTNGTDTLFRPTIATIAAHSPLEDPSVSVPHKLLYAMTEEDMTGEVVECIPFGVMLPLRQALQYCKHNPPANYPSLAYQLIQREDLIYTSHTRHADPSPVTAPTADSDELTAQPETSDGTEIDNAVTRVRFSGDLRLKEVRRLLTSSRVISLKPPAAHAESDVINEQQNRLLLLAKRTMALAVGRGMFTMATREALLTEPISIPPLQLNGRIKATKTGVTLDTSILPVDVLTWPQFHNGVAAALRISPTNSCYGNSTNHSSSLTSTWIMYNKTFDSLSTGHGGVLMGLGLTGHLASLEMTKVFEYLSSGNESVSIGLLLGIAAAHRASMETSVAKLLSIHIPALHPPASTNIEVPWNVQTAATLALGLLYQGTAHRRMSEVLLEEINRKPEDQQSNREGHALAAGFALGFVNLGCGAHPALSDLQIEDRLNRYIDGGKNKHDEERKSITTLEGTNLNTAITAPAAVIALALIYLKTENTTIAARLNIPDTTFLLSTVSRADLLLLKVLSKSLILWSSIAPTEQWIAAQVPAVLQQALFKRNHGNMHDAELESLREAHMNIVGGACVAVGLRYAGTANADAFQLLLRYSKYFLALLSNEHSAAAETVMNMVLLSLAMVMAGTGNLEVLRLLRKVRKRIGSEYTYGNYMCMHMAIGFLFLGGGRYSLATSNEAIAALLCAVYPQFPCSTNDNRYHLQAFRHLYVLAAELRCLELRDVDTHQPCFVPIEITVKQNDTYRGTSMKCVAPCIIPEYALIDSIRVCSDRYWSLQLNLNSMKSLHTLLAESQGIIYVKKKTGFLSYIHDPKSFRSILSRTYPKYIHTISGERKQKNKTEFVESFSADRTLLAFSYYFCDEPDPNVDQSHANFYTGVLYECLTQEKPEILGSYLALHSLLDHAEEASNRITTHLIWNIKIALQFDANINKIAAWRNQDALIQRNFLTCIESKLNSFFYNMQDMKTWLRTLITRGTYPSSATPQQLNLLGCYLAYYELPSTAVLSQIQQVISNTATTTGAAVLPLLSVAFTDCSHKALHIIAQLLSS